MAQPNTPIDPSQVQWDAIDPNKVQWDGPTVEQQQLSSAPRRFLQGLRDPVDFGAQLLTHVLPQSVVDAGNTANNWLADKTGLVSKIPERNLSGLVTGKTGGLDQMLADQEKTYQDARAATGNTGMDWYRAAGNIVSPTNLVPGIAASKAATLSARLLAGAGAGAVSGATSSPVTEGDFWGETAKKGIAGGAAGGMLTGAASGLARLIKPETRDAISKLLSEGVTPTPGQILGGRWQTTEDKLTSVPVLGDAISSARSKSLDEFNRAAYARALDPIGGSTAAPVGREAVTDVKGQLGRAYENILPFLNFKADNQFSGDINKISSMATSMPGPQAQQFQQILKDKVISRLGPNGAMDGEAYKGVESELGRIAKGYKADGSFDNRQLGDAISELQNSLRANLARSNPQYAKELGDINQGYANYTRIRDAASRQGSADGRFTPAQLGAAVRGQDKSVGKGNYATGDALMQDLTDAGKDALSSKYPDSGSIGRLLMYMGGAGVAGHSAGVSVPLVVGGAAATAPYLPIGRQLAAALLARRPDMAEPIANTVRKLGPVATPAALPFVPGFQSGNH